MLQSLNPEPTQPLSGVRIIDMTSAWAGPMATRLMAYLGADVIHIEGPHQIDRWRGTPSGPDPIRYPETRYVDKHAGDKPFNQCCMFNTQNASKRGIAVDLKTPAGLDIIRRLIRVSDALVSNFRPGVLSRLGLGMEDIIRENSSIVVLDMPAFGPDGVASRRGAVGPTMEAACGMSYFIGYGDGRPHVTGPAFLDPVGAFNAAAALVTALAGRKRGSHINRVELSQCEAAMHWIGEMLITSGGDSPSQPDSANASDTAEPHGAYQCSGDDNWVVLAISSDEEWAALRDVMRHSGLTVHDDLDDMLGRRRKREQVHDIVTKWTEVREKQSVASHLQTLGITCAPINNGSDMILRPDLMMTGFHHELFHRDVGRRLYQGLPIRYDNHLLRAKTAAPLFGEHNSEVIKNLLGLSDIEYLALEEAGVVSDSPAV